MSRDILLRPSFLFLSLPERPRNLLLFFRRRFGLLRSSYVFRRRNRHFHAASLHHEKCADYVESRSQRERVGEKSAKGKSTNREIKAQNKPRSRKPRERKIRVNRVGRQYREYTRQCRKGGRRKQVFPGKNCHSLSLSLSVSSTFRNRSPLIRSRTHFYDVTPAAGSSMDCRRQDKYVLRSRRVTTICTKCPPSPLTFIKKPYWSCRARSRKPRLCDRVAQLPVKITTVTVELTFCTFAKIHSCSSVD